MTFVVFLAGGDKSNRVLFHCFVKSAKLLSLRFAQYAYWVSFKMLFLFPIKFGNSLVNGFNYRPILGSLLLLSIYSSSFLWVIWHFRVGRTLLLLYTKINFMLVGSLN